MGQAFLYGTGGGGTGGTLTVTAPAGVIVTISKDGKTKTKTADENGVAVFKGLKTGTWTVVITDGPQISPTRQVVVTADYDVTMNFFSATIVVTYPEGSTCTCSDGKTVLTAPDTSGICTFTVNNAGEWTVKAVSGSDSASESVSITTDGQSESVTLDYTLVLFSTTEAYVGTFEAKAWKPTGASTTVKAPTLNIDDSAMTITLASGSGISGIVINDTPIDLSKWKTLRITLKSSVTISENANIRYGVCDAYANGFNYIAYKGDAGSASTTLTEYTVDLTDANQTGYFFFRLYNANKAITITITDIRLE